MVEHKPDPSWGEPVLMPRPPAVMKKPCGDCAYRLGSPETEYASRLPGAARPFWCHHGVPLVDGDYQPTCVDGYGRPVGLMVCGGWWARMIGDEEALAAEFRELPEREYAETGRPCDVLRHERSNPNE